MYSWLSTQIGADAAQVVSYIIGVSALAFIAWLGIAFLRHRSKALFIVLGKNRPMRLSVRDAAAVDAQRRIVLVRRDDTEHLILIGGPSDVVIECNITPPDVKKPVAEKQEAVKAAPPVQPALLPDKKPAGEQARPAAIIQARTAETGSDEQIPVPKKKIAATEQPAAIPSRDNAAARQEMPLLEDEAEAMLLAIEQAVQDDFLLEAEDESHILPSIAQTPAPKVADTAHPASSVRQPASARLHELQPRQQRTPAAETARTPLPARTHTAEPRTAPAAAAKPAYRQPPVLKSVSAASQVSRNTTAPTTRKATPANLLPNQETQPRPPLFVKQRSEAVTAESRKPPEKTGQTDFKPFLPADNKDFEKLIQEELLRTQINLKTPLPNKN